MYAHFEGGWGLRKYILYTQLNVDNYAWPLTHNLFLDSECLREDWSDYESGL